MYLITDITIEVGVFLAINKCFMIISVKRRGRRSSFLQCICVLSEANHEAKHASEVMVRLFLAKNKSKMRKDSDEHSHTAVYPSFVGIQTRDSVSLQVQARHFLCAPIVHSIS